MNSLFDADPVGGNGRFLDGSVVLVTGGSKNLGRSIALRSAELGAAVAVNAVRDQKGIDAVTSLIRSFGGAAASYLADVTDPSQVLRMVEETRTQLGPISALVHCAAHRGRHLPITDIPPDQWERVIAVTLDGAFLCTQAALPHMLERGYGRFVYIGGPASYTGRPEGSTHGSSAKAGLEGLARSVAQEFGGQGVTANVVTPGLMATDRAVPGTLSGWPAGKPRGELMQMDEIADFVVRLCAERFHAANGSHFMLDGGLIAL
jgi:3-oxoacyl-[acyl-carrier protein] reductase